MLILSCAELMPFQFSANSPISSRPGVSKPVRCTNGLTYSVMLCSKSQHFFREMELWGGLLKDIQTDIDTGVATSCFVGDYLKDRADHGHVDAPGCGLTDDGWLKDTLLAYTAGTVLEAGSDTTASTMQSFILFMLSHPAVYAKVRSEMDSVVGPDRMPIFDDEPNLPYLVACIKETLRKRPPTIMGM